MRDDFILQEINARVTESGNFNDILSKIKIKKNMPKKSFQFRFKLVSVIASFLIIMTAVYAGLNLGIGNDTTSTNIGSSIANETISSNNGKWEIMYEEKKVNQSELVLRWDEKTLIQKYSGFRYNDTLYLVWSTNSLLPIDIEFIGDAFDTIVLTGFDVYEDKTYEINATLFKINKINPDCAVAIQYEGDSNFYTFVNHFHKFETLGDLIDELNLKEYGLFGTTNYEYVDNNGSHLIRFEDFSDEIVWNNLLFDERKENVFLSNNQQMNSNYMSIRISIPALGIIDDDASWIGINKNGLMKIHILTGNTNESIFYIGEEKVSMFANYLIDNIKGYEIVYVQKDDENISKEDNNSSALMTSKHRALESLYLLKK